MIDRAISTLAVLVGGLVAGATIYYAVRDPLGAAEAVTIFARAGL